MRMLDYVPALIENHEHDPLCEGLVLYCAEHPGSDPKKHLNCLLASGCSGHCRRRTHVRMEAQQSRKVRKIHRKSALSCHFPERFSTVIVQTSKRAYGSPSQIPQFLPFWKEACSTAGASESNPLALLLNLFSRILTRAPNSWQDLQERMFLELLLLPN